MQEIARIPYLEKLISLRDKDLIKVITGVRRCGKSTLLHLFRDYLLSDGVGESQIVYLNFEDYDNKPLRDPDSLYAYLKPTIQSGVPTYVLLDEIQQVVRFEEVIDSLYQKKGVDIYLTGSNAYMLSSEIATLLSGRYIEIKVYPFSFKEICGIPVAESAARRYSDYVRYGSFPYVQSLLDNPSLVADYLESLYNTIVLKDIMQRRRFTDPLMLDSIIRFMFDNIGNMVSSKSIADTLTSNGRKIDVKTVERYLDAMMDCFILYEAKRYDIKGKQLLKTLGKYYVVDPGMRNVLLGNRGYDVGRVLENVVFLELKRRYREVYIGKLDSLEVDFVAVDEGGITYYQVAETVREQSTLERELRPFTLIGDHYPKFLLTLDEDPPTHFDGIRKVNVLDWLVE